MLFVPRVTTLTRWFAQCARKMLISSGVLVSLITVSNWSVSKESLQPWTDGQLQSQLHLGGPSPAADLDLAVVLSPPARPREGDFPVSLASARSVPPVQASAVVPPVPELDYELLASALARALDACSTPSRSRSRRVSVVVPFVQEALGKFPSIGSSGRFSVCRSVSWCALCWSSVGASFRS